MNGTLYGIGVGPGDPELLTLKAIRTVDRCNVIAIPVSDRSFQTPVFVEDEKEDMQLYLEKCVAYQIMHSELSDVESMDKLFLPMPMIKDREVLKIAHERAADALEEQLKKGKNVAFLTLGDPTIYSTYLYMHKRIKERGYQTKIIPGIPSFCAAAARMNVGLVENREELHVIPASYEIEEGLTLQGTKVLMKAGTKMPYVKENVQKRALKFWMVENCGMSSEQIYTKVEDVPMDASYYSLMIIKEES